MNAQAMEARRAETVKLGSVHDSAVPKGCARKTDPMFLTHRIIWSPRHTSSTHRTTDAHRRAKHGALVPMDEPESISPMTWLFLAAVASPFIAALAGALA